MSRRVRVLALVAGVFAALALGAPAAAASNASAGAAQFTRYCDFQILNASLWSTGYFVNAKVQNISDVPVSMSASVPIQPPGYIVHVWGVALATTAGSTAVLRPWTPTLEPGEILYFGYTGTGQYRPATVVCEPVA